MFQLPSGSDVLDQCLRSAGTRNQSWDVVADQAALTLRL